MYYYETICVAATSFSMSRSLLEYQCRVEAVSAILLASSTIAGLRKATTGQTCICINLFVCLECYKCFFVNVRVLLTYRSSEM